MRSRASAFILIRRKSLNFVNSSLRAFLLVLFLSEGLFLSACNNGFHVAANLNEAQDLSSSHKDCDAGYELLNGICVAVLSAAGLPYVAPSSDDILNSPKKVFAHYVVSPLMTGPKDYWPNNTCMLYLVPQNTPSAGGNNRLCPAFPIMSGANAQTYIIDNLKTEIRRMIARGINGIALNLFNVCDWSESGATCGGATANPGSGGAFGYPGTLINLLNAAAAVDSRFKILPMPDMTAGIKPSDLPNLWRATIGGRTIYNHPNIYRWPDANNYPELSPFGTEAYPASQYSDAFATMRANGVPISWAPIFGSLGCNGSVNGCVFSPYASLPTVSIGGVGGTVTDPGLIEGALVNIGGTTPGHPTYGGGTPINWTGPVNIFGGMSPQAYQSAGGTLYESQNSLAYRTAWETEIGLGAALGNMMIFTWNDYGENTAVAPSQNQYGEPSMGFYDLTGYYTTWFRKGAAPALSKDAILYFYRRQTYAAAHNATLAGLTKPPTMVPYMTPTDNIEMIAFLSSPATLSISINGVASTMAGKVGLNSFKIPLVAGTPTFSIIRQSATVLALPGITTYGSGQIPGLEVPGIIIPSPVCAKSPCFPTGIPDPVYYSGSTF